MLKQFLALRDAGETPENLIEICLKRIAERDPEVRAWVVVAPQPVSGDGPLRGIPFGVKDIFETKGLPISYGSPVYQGSQSTTDAELVALLRRRGAAVLGKTHTTAFAYFDPAPTRNPRNPSHTPGGSSSGSAAAVADGMVPFALGSQTQGSIVRPASFCGVAGFKPSFGRLPTEGIMPFAPSLDTAGFFTQTAEEMQLLWTLGGFGARASAESSLATPRIGLLSPLPELDPSMSQAVLMAADHLGAAVVEFPSGFGDLFPAARLVSDYEGARTHQERWREHGAAIGEKLAALVQQGLRIPEERYLEARGFVEIMRTRMAPLFREYPVLLSPSAVGPAPLGLAFTGDPRMNSPWTALGGPALSLPMPVEGLPLGLQLTAQAGCDDMLLAAAVGIERQLCEARF